MLKEIKDWKEAINQVVNMDCLNLMKKMPDKSVDLVLTDPPYGVDYEGGAVNKFKREVRE